MHIVVIAWLWVILMMAITERTFIAGVLTFLFYGLAPCTLLLWLIATQRKFRKHKSPKQARPSDEESVREEQVEGGDRQDAKAD